MKKKQLKMLHIVALLSILSVFGMTISASASINWGTAVPINSVGQPVDTITVDGKTVTALYAPRSSIAKYDSDTTYCCAAFVKRFYSTIFGVSVRNLSPGDTPIVSSGSFEKTTTPKVGDIAASSDHWAIVKAVSGNDVTLIEQNCWNTAYTSAMVGRVLSSESSYWYWRWSGNSTDLVASGDSGSVSDTVSDVSEFEIENGILKKYNGTASRVEIPDTVTTIGESAFAKNAYIRVVTIPDTVLNIEKKAFYDCNSLVVVSMPQTVESIGESAFEGCELLSSISLPENKKFTTIEAGVFKGDSSLEDITFPEQLTEINSCAFEETGLTNASLPENITYIHNRAFYSCKQLSQLVLPKYLNKYGASAFAECDALTSVEIPKTLETIDYTPDYGFSVGKDYYFMHGMFYGCDRLSNVTFEKGTTAIADSLFYGCIGLENIEIPDTVTTIGYNAFARCYYLKNVTIPDSVTEIKQMAFYYCESLESVQLPDDIQTIGPCAFQLCTSLSQVNLPKHIKTLGTWSFKGCSSLTSITIPASLKEVSNYYNGVAINTTESPFLECSLLKNVTLEDGMTSIPAALFRYAYSLENITIPNTVTKIENAVFSNCTALQEIQFPDSLKTIGGYAFYNCTSLQEVTLPDTVTSMGQGVFEQCSLLEKVHLPNQRVNVMDDTFKNCISLKEVNLPDTLRNFKSGCFYGCTALESITFSDQIKDIESSAFENCTKLTEVDIKAASIGSAAFKGCYSLVRISVSDRVKSIGSEAFAGCSSLETIHLSTAIKQLGDNLFTDCAYLQSVVIPYGVEKIGASCFTNCSKLTDVMIPQSTTTIPEGIFSYLDRVTIRGVSGSYAQTYAQNQGITFSAVNQSVTGISLELEDMTIAKGEYAAPGLNVTPEDFTDEVVWSTSDEEVATVGSTGIIEGKGQGTCTITVSVGNLKKECKVTVYIQVSKISLAGEQTVSAGKSILLEATVSPDNATDKTLTWSSSDESIATVSQDGKVTGKAMGTVTITATAKDGSGVIGEKEITVTGSTSSQGDFTLADSSDYVITDNLLTGVKLNQNTVSAVTAQFTNANLVCVDASGNQLSDSDTLGTGSCIRIMDGGTVQAECTVVIAGDIVGDGKIAGKDVNMLAQSCVAKTTLSDAQKAAADLDGDGSVTGKDVNILAQVCVGKKTISSQE
jgi:hypothetical protein